MKIVPLVEFWLRRHQQIADMINPKNSGAVLELFAAVLPVIKQRWPELNKDGILDDALQTLTVAHDDPNVTDAVNNPGARTI